MTDRPPRLPQDRLDFGDIDAGDEAAREAGVDALDMQAQAPAIRRLRTWLIEQLEPQPGWSVLDVGCGTGDDARDLAALVGPQGSALGVDLSSTMLAEARRRSSAARTRARFVAGSASALPVRDAAMHVVRSERVLQHLADPEAAVAEMVRVLRPGGRLGLIDTDWRTLALWPADEAADRAVRAVWARNVATPAAGARLRELVAGAGLTASRATTDVLLLRPRRVEEPPLSLMVDAVAGEQALPEATLARWRVRLAQAAADGVLVATVTMHAVVGTRPEELSATVRA